MNVRSLIVASSFLAAIAAGTVANLATPQKEYSETENRYLQTFPQLSLEEVASGRFSSSFETYTTDQFWNRDGWVGLKTLTQLLMLNKDNGRAYFGKDGYLFEKNAPYDSRLVTSNCEAVADFLEEARALSPGLDARVMLVPTAAAILSEKLPALAPVPDQSAVIAAMGQAAGDALLDPTEALRAGRAQGLFYRTDHHWTTAGAYAGYCVYMQGKGELPLPSSAFRREAASDAFYGTVYSKANLYTIRPDTLEIWEPLEANPCTVVWNGGSLDGLYDRSYLEVKDKYSVFLGGNHPLTRVSTSVGNGKTLLLVKDSYANAMVPFLAQHYETILLADLRYYKESLRPLLADGQVDDLLVIYNVEGFAAEKTVSAVLPDALRKGD